jgi:hypothetical protein
MASTKIGTATTAQAQPTSKSKNKDGNKRTLTWEGDYTHLSSQFDTYTIDVSMIDGLTVRSATLDPMPGGMARLTVEIDDIVAGGGGGGSGNDPVYELDWTRVDKDLRSHPKFNTGGIYALTNSEKAEVDKAIKGDAAAPTTGNKLQLYQRLLKGVVAYPVGVPVARSTTYTITRPTATGTWIRGTPPALCGAPANNPQSGAAYTYVKTADRIIKRSGGFERVQEWSGFEDADELIYPT